MQGCEACRKAFSQKGVDSRYLLWYFIRVPGKISRGRAVR